MRRSIRQQVLVPILTIQTVALAAITIASVALAARRTERQIVDRLNGVVDVLDRSNFPLTGAVLARMKGLSGADFVAYDAGGLPIAASGPGLVASGPALGAIPVWSPQRFQSLSDSPTLDAGRPAPLRRAHRSAVLGHGGSPAGSLSRVELARGPAGIRRGRP